MTEFCKHANSHIAAMYTFHRRTNAIVRMWQYRRVDNFKNTKSVTNFGWLCKGIALIPTSMPAHCYRTRALFAFVFRFGVSSPATYFSSAT